MSTAYSVKTESGEITEFGNRSRWVRLKNKTISTSDRFELDLITAGMPTDPPAFVQDVEAFYKFLHANRVTGRSWTFKTPEVAREAYDMLVRIGSY